MRGKRRCGTPSSSSFRAMQSSTRASLGPGRVFSCSCRPATQLQAELHPPRSDTSPRFQPASREGFVRPTSLTETTLRRHRRPSTRALLRSLLRPSRFAVVGVIGIGVNAVALVFFTEVLGLHYALSAVL